MGSGSFFAGRVAELNDKRSINHGVNPDNPEGEKRILHLKVTLEKVPNALLVKSLPRKYSNYSNILIF